MAITNLYAKYRYNGTNLPILLLAHGWRGDANSWDGDDTIARLSDGLFVASVGMRGRNGAGGSPDASGREIYDLYDALTYIRANHAGIVDPDKAAIMGSSGGGGNALAAACKFPDTFNVIVDYFGMSDYGRSNPNGWYYNNGGAYTAELVTWVGDTPANAPNEYYARDATAAIANYSGGYLYLYHDKQDTTVPVIHSDRIKTALDAAGLTNYELSETDIGDNPRWLHGYPADNPDLKIPEATWVAKIKSQAAWTIPASGTVTVIGYIVTKRFTIWLNSGLDATATVVYDTTTGQYTVTPLTTGDIAVSITQGALHASATINSETTLTVS